MKVTAYAIPLLDFKQYVRAGCVLTTEPKEYDVSDDQLAALQADKRVTVAVAKDAPKPSAKPAAKDV